jgi:hypothetical protein
MPGARLKAETLKLAMEGQIFDEGGGLQPGTVKKGFPALGTVLCATVFCRVSAAGIRLLAEAARHRGEVGQGASFRLA